MQAMAGIQSRKAVIAMSNLARTARINDGVFAVCGIVSVLVALIIALAAIPDEFANAGALFSSAVALAVGISAVPLVRATICGWRDAFRAEHFLMVALVYWILLDLLQTTYPLSEVDGNDVELAFIAIATMAVGIWTGVSLPAWRLPAPLVRASCIEFEPKTLYTAVWICFFLGTFNYALQSGFDIQTIVDGLLLDRWAAPWSRGAPRRLVLHPRTSAVFWICSA